MEETEETEKIREMREMTETRLKLYEEYIKPIVECTYMSDAEKHFLIQHTMFEKIFFLWLKTGERDDEWAANGK